MKKVYRREFGSPLTSEQQRRLDALSKLPDSEIDTSDIPELPSSSWKNAERGKFYRPIKKAISLRLDADVIEWLRKDGEGYQTRANQMLRGLMVASLKQQSVGQKNRSFGYSPQNLITVQTSFKQAPSRLSSGQVTVYGIPNMGCYFSSSNYAQESLYGIAATGITSMMQGDSCENISNTAR